MEHLIKHPALPDAYATITSDIQYGWVLDSVIVPDEYREQGIGTELVQEVMRWCKTKNIKSLYFLAYNQDFWDALRKKFPKNIRINLNREGELRP
jgi:GNAT superfamily N-acetyltransferase